MSLNFIRESEITDSLSWLCLYQLACTKSYNLNSKMFISKM